MPSPALKPNHTNKLGIWSLTAIVVGSAIGAGCFTTSGFLLADLKDPVWVLLAWAVAGGIAFCGALSYGGLSRHITGSGGEYLYLTKTVSPLAGFLAGWVSLFAGFTGAIAYASHTFEAYFLPLTASTASLPEGIIASLIILICGCQHAFHFRSGTRLQNIAVGAKLVLLLGFIALAGILLWGGANDINGSQNATMVIEPFPGLLAFAISLMWISFSYSGFNASIYIAGQAYQPERNIRRSMTYGTLAIILVYLGLNTVFVYSAPVSELAGQPDIAAIAAKSIGGERVEFLARAIICVALFTSVSAMMMIGPRVYAKMAADNVFPRFFHSENSVPKNAIILQVVLALAVMWMSNLRELLSYMGFSLMISSAATIGSLFLLKIKRPEIDLTSSIPGYPLPPLVFIGSVVFTATYTVIYHPGELFWSLMLLLSGFLFYFLVKYRRSPAPAGTS